MQQVINGLSSGAVYALIALGYSLIFSVMRMVNMAHCDVMMAGAYTGWLCADYLGLGLFASCAAAALVCGALGLVIERLVCRPIRGAGLSLMTASIGVSLLIEYIFMLVFGADARAYPPGFTGGVLSAGGLNLPQSKLTALGAALILALVLQIFLFNTQRGRAMRAVADDEKAARLCGIDEKKAAGLAFAAGSALAGAAGVIYGSMYLVTPLMGVSPGMKAFAAAVIGGIGDLGGAVLGGFVLGLTETLAGNLFGTAFKNAAAYIILIVILLLSPGGLTGSKFGKARL
ncbi:MAG: branched-chain amino acid ABC transporter permease [Oscillospiraceae bacterium]|jgi:branched-chain amino acid transport system permease protein|nr:branched-chain amino acid ABC transporter permease [Oscillospiraceae bacterium]